MMGQMVQSKVTGSNRPEPFEKSKRKRTLFHLRKEELLLFFFLFFLGRGAARGVPCCSGAMKMQARDGGKSQTKKCAANAGRRRRGAPPRGCGCGARGQRWRATARTGSDSRAAAMSVSRRARAARSLRGRRWWWGGMSGRAREKREASPVGRHCCKRSRRMGGKSAAFTS